MNFLSISAVLGLTAFMNQTTNSKDDSVIIMSPAHPVTEGEQVVLRCHYSFHKPNRTTFYKDGKEVSSLNVTEMVIDNVTSTDEGFYKCADPEDKSASPERWLAVQGTWTWVVLSSCIVGILLLITLILILVCHYRWHLRCTGGWLSSKEGPTSIQAPQTKQDVTEIQWDLAWMEMANLLDKQEYTASDS
ncbi:hypothetical protein UPYG_G00029050 [Umbra pygmaea]|uniref:Ig-like domain-containing protein n=1 Tax=Umbra pygmaea TaxID=75934 RepID=A0ABD0XMG3_UMBPY